MRKTATKRAKTRSFDFQSRFDPIRTLLLKKIKPDPNEYVQVQSVIQDLNKKLKAINKNVTFQIGGSLAKNTHVRGTFDADIFALFSGKQTENISDELEKILRKLSLSPVRLHGSRDYFQVSLGKITFEFIPVLKITSSKYAKNVTDVSPLHTIWFSKNATEYMKDDVRIAKLFLKAHKLYGAESYISGFSGHMVDILIVHYGSFQSMLAKLSITTTLPVIIDPAKHYAKTSEVYTSLDEMKLQGPLILVDPVDPLRNAAAALSHEQFSKFCTVAKKLLSNPSPSLFESQSLYKKIPQSKNNFTIFITLTPLENKTDIQGGKIKKVFSQLKEHIVSQGFTLKKSDWEFDPSQKQAILFFCTTKDKTDPYYLQKGPTDDQQQHHIDMFKRVHAKHVIVKKGKTLYAKVPRKHILLKKILKLKLEELQVNFETYSLKIVSKR